MFSNISWAPLALDILAVLAQLSGALLWPLLQVLVMRILSFWFGDDGSCSGPCFRCLSFPFSFISSADQIFSVSKYSSPLPSPLTKYFPSITYDGDSKIMVRFSFQAHPALLLLNIPGHGRSLSGWDFVVIVLEDLYSWLRRTYKSLILN